MDVRLIDTLKATRNPATRDEVNRYESCLAEFASLPANIQKEELENLFEVFHNEGQIHLMMSLVHFVESHMPDYLNALINKTDMLQIHADEWLNIIYQRIFNSFSTNQMVNLPTFNKALQGSREAARMSVLNFLNTTFKQYINARGDPIYVNNVLELIRQITENQR